MVPVSQLKLDPHFLYALLHLTRVRVPPVNRGENNVFQCHDAGDAGQSHGGAGGGPAACGTVKDSTGYACMMSNLITQVRSRFLGMP